MSETRGLRGPYVWITAAVVVLDQVAKHVVDRLMALHESHQLLDGVLRLTYVRNRGAAFGILSDAELPYQSMLFSALSLVALLAIALYAWRLPASSRLPKAALAMIMGGAVGNLLDRARLGYVIDFVDVYWGSHHWPAFNVADSAISVGVALLVLDMLWHPRAPRAETSAQMDADHDAAARVAEREAAGRAAAEHGLPAPSSGGE
jgi:signal peptidase II